jgi:hypothetical protein
MSMVSRKDTIRSVRVENLISSVLGSFILEEKIVMQGFIKFTGILENAIWIYLSFLADWALVVAAMGEKKKKEAYL